VLPQRDPLPLVSARIRGNLVILNCCGPETVKKLSNHVLGQLLKSSPHGVLVADARQQDLPVIFVNPAMAQLTGKPVGSVLGQPVLLLAKRGPAADEKTLLDGLTAGREYSLSMFGSDNTPSGYALRLVPLAARDGVPEFVAGFAEAEAPRVSDRGETASLSAERPATTDRVTGLPTADSMRPLLEQVCFASESESTTIILLEMQAFDVYRDTFGPQAADSTLRLVSRAIAGSLRRASDRVGRMDGARLIAVVEKLGDEDALQLAQRICARVRDLSIHHPRSPVSRYVTVAAGVAHVEPGDTVERLLQRAHDKLSATPVAGAD